MINKGTSSSILVSGESGSGKTETAKMLMKYLAYIGGRPEVERCTVEQKILESNPVLEAFGNAKTVNNNNSSRFSKFVGIQFSQSRSISGATIETCLLEKSRVCHIANGERNYHIFYRLCAAPPEVQEKYNLGSPKSFHYLKQSDCYELDGVNDADEYLATRKAMDIVGISEDEQEAIFRVVAAILHLGNIEFAIGKEIDSSAIEGKDLYMCSLNQVIVKKINNSIGQDRNSKSIIGVLDITGFESYDHNSFEQFCINYSNEKLQQHFNQHVSEMKQKEYTKGETKWSSIDFARNQAVLNLIEDKPGGIIALLDDACLFPKSTHGKFANKWYDADSFKNNEHFTIPKGSQSTFTISHNGGEVTYEADLFLKKNKDYVVVEYHNLLTTSRCPFVVGLFLSIPAKSSNSSKFLSIGSSFKKQLHSLMDKLNTMKPQYIRCMKPNNCLKPAIFENHNIVRQLRHGGVLEAILICNNRYPTREFAHPSAVLAPKVVEGNDDDRALCKRTPDKMGLKGDQANQGEIQTYDSYGFLASWCECDRIHPAIKENVDVVSFGNFIKVVSSTNRSRILLWSLGKWCGDATNSFHFQFGEMTLTPLDFTMITSLEVGGMPLLFDSNMHLSKSTVDGCLGERFLVSVQYKEHVPYTAIYIGFSSFDYRTPWEVIDLTRAVPLCLLRTSIFANLEKIVPLGVYKLLEHSQTMRLFNWDGTLLATIYGYMGAILRNITNWIGGFYPVWEMWCHTYLNMFAPRNHFPHHGSFLRGQRWITEYMGKRTDGDFVSSVRGLLRTMIVKQLPSHLRSMHQVNHQSRILIEGLYYMEGYLVERVVMRSLNFSAFRLPHPPPSMRHAFKLEGRMLEQVLEGDEVIAPIQDGDYQDNIRDFLMHPFNEDVPFPQANFAAAHLGVIKSSPGSLIQTELSEIGQTDADGTQFTHVFQPSKQGHVAQMFSSLTQQCVKMTNTMKNIIRKWELKLVQSCSSGAARDVAFDPSRAGGIRIKEPNFRGGEGPSQSRKLTSPQGFVALYYPVTKPRSKDKGGAKRGCK